MDTREMCTLRIRRIVSLEGVKFLVKYVHCVLYCVVTCRYAMLQAIEVRFACHKIESISRTKANFGR